MSIPRSALGVVLALVLVPLTGYLRYVAPDQDWSGEILARYEVLMLDLASGAQATVRVMAPEAAYDDSVAHQVLETVRVS